MFVRDATLLRHYFAMKTALEPGQKIIYAVGVIVLTSQDVERHLKFLVPFMNSDDPATTSILARHAKLGKRSLGDVSGQFVGAMSGDVEALECLVRQIVEERNEIVHHFQDRFGDLIQKGGYEEVLDALRGHHGRALDLLRVLREMSLALAEAMRDGMFAGTPEQGEIALLCEKARASLTS